MTSSLRDSRRALALLVVVLAATACGTHRYAGDSRTEAKDIGDRYILRHYPKAATMGYSGMHKAHVLGRQAWMLIYERGSHSVCVYVWYSDYHDDDFAISRRCS